MSYFYCSSIPLNQWDKGTQLGITSVRNGLGLLWKHKCYLQQLCLWKPLCGYCNKYCMLQMCFFELHMTAVHSVWNCSASGWCFWVKDRSWRLWAERNLLSKSCLGEATQRKRALSCWSLKYLFDTIDTYSCCSSVWYDWKPQQDINVSHEATSNRWSFLNSQFLCSKKKNYKNL